MNAPSSVVGETELGEFWRRKGWSDADGGCGDGHTRLLGMSFRPLKVPK